MDAFVVKQSVTQRKSPRDLGSPGNHQLLLPQLSSPNLLNFGPLLTILHDLIVELSILLGVFPFSFNLKLDVSWFIYAMFNAGLSRGCMVY